MTDLSISGNLLVVYRVEASEVVDTTDETELPSYLQKYVEYGTASRALRANTDGRIESLADYWELRKKAAYEVIKKWNRQKLSAWRIRLATRDGSPGSSRPKYPRLPSSYPDEVV